MYYYRRRAKRYRYWYRLIRFNLYELGSPVISAASISETQNTINCLSISWWLQHVQSRPSCLKTQGQRKLFQATPCSAVPGSFFMHCPVTCLLISIFISRFILHSVWYFLATRRPLLDSIWRTMLFSPAVWTWKAIAHHWRMPPVQWQREVLRFIFYSGGSHYERLRTHRGRSFPADCTTAPI